MAQSAANAFGAGAGRADTEEFERERDRLHAWIGQQAAEFDWHPRKVLGWAMSNTMGTSLCLEALEKALNSTGKVPEILNTDQGCQFTSVE